MADPSHVYDVVVLGGGGAGCAAAIEASQLTSSLLLVTKGSLKDSKTHQAQGGIQAAFGAEDSPDEHLEDTLRTGQYANDPKLVRILADSARATIHWLETLGVTFDKRHGSTCCKRPRG